MIHTIGIDIGSGAVKSVLFRHGDGAPVWLGLFQPQTVVPRKNTVQQ